MKPGEETALIVYGSDKTIRAVCVLPAVVKSVWRPLIKRERTCFVEDIMETHNRLLFNGGCW